ncbi:NUDIX hydrolase [Sabulicella rubraurantiaca]|uniref:NUDIX hydrolase n=1 Tax=Sabulicella rubraurantiaca TaxID=2811429 RepID=UPI001A96AEA5|nr:NUDIX hydrolase [Sabulicella rubraurantiaca]
MSNSREYPDRPWIGIGVIAFRGDTVLLVRRGRPPRMGAWSLPGGAQHVGEGAQEAARRELREEAGIEVGPLLLADVIDSVTRDENGRVRFHYTIVDFCGEYLSGETVAGDDAAEVRWAPLDALEPFDLTPEARAVIALSRRRLDEARG